MQRKVEGKPPFPTGALEHRQTDRQAVPQTDRQTVPQTDRQTVPQTDRQCRVGRLTLPLPASPVFQDAGSCGKHLHAHVCAVRDAFEDTRISPFCPERASPELCPAYSLAHAGGCLSRKPAREPPRCPSPHSGQLTAGELGSWGAALHFFPS